ncbi:hypothetical protein P5673_017191 [Acropora cervicornis]|uniref:Uncharacterized protein n=1 Tax=Acropora cervicornis TaxID=6130 RepID=A0AAD9QFW8_ACRCE|nr:hypothetical protein P5673_017191 [Acropora cervicornis]
MSAGSSNELEDADRKTDAAGSDILEKVHSLFGESVYQALQTEEITDDDSIADLAARDPDAPIYTRLGLTYGKALRFRKEFGTKSRIHKSDSRPSYPATKPSMADMSMFTPEMRQFYLSKRKKIGLLAASRWKDELPKFNTPSAKVELDAFAAEITPECGIPEINFAKEGISKHIQSFFNEQRRYRKIKKPASKIGTLSCETNKYKGDNLIEETSAEEKLSTAGSTSSGGESSGGGDTDILGEDENEIMQDCSDSSNGSPIPSSQLSSVALNQKQTGHHWSFKVNQAIVKCVFQRLLKRDEMIEVLKKKFSVSPRNLTGLAPTQLLSVLAKKLVNNKYCKVTEEVKNFKEDITVIKEIEF